jgi:hypothetical protein
MNKTFTAEELGEYLCVSEDVVNFLINSAHLNMNSNALTEKDIKLILDKNPKLIGDLTEFISWYYLEYSVDEVEATDKRYALVQQYNWYQAMGWQ